MSIKGFKIGENIEKVDYESLENKPYHTASEIDEKLGKITDVDTEYNPESENPQSGKAVAQALANFTGDAEIPENWAGKSLLLFGDSITEENTYTGYYEWLKNLLSLGNVVNLARSGKSTYSVYDDIKNTTEDADVIIVMIGVNDQTQSLYLGREADTDRTSTYGNFYNICKLLKEKYPTKLIFFITPHYQNKYLHSDGITSYEVSRAMIYQATRFSIPVYDNYVFSGICEHNLSAWTYDGCHWNNKAHEMLGRNLAKWMTDNFRYLIETVHTTGITLDKSSLSFSAPTSQQLTATVEPENSTDAIIWKSSDNTIASVSTNGLVTAHKSGNVTITATSGEYSATCDVSVSIISYTVTYNLKGLTSSNTNVTVDPGSGYQTTIIVEDGKTLDYITCTMGGESVTVNNGVINITEVTGDIVISGYAYAIDSEGYRPLLMSDIELIENGSKSTVDENGNLTVVQDGSDNTLYSVVKLNNNVTNIKGIASGPPCMLYVDNGDGTYVGMLEGTYKVDIDASMKGSLTNNGSTLGTLAAGSEAYYDYEDGAIYVASNKDVATKQAGANAFGFIVNKPHIKSAIPKEIKVKVADGVSKYLEEDSVAGTINYTDFFFKHGCAGAVKATGYAGFWFNESVTKVKCCAVTAAPCFIYKDNGDGTVNFFYHTTWRKYKLTGTNVTEIEQLSDYTAPSKGDTMILTLDDQTLTVTKEDGTPIITLTDANCIGFLSYGNTNNLPAGIQRIS